MIWQDGHESVFDSDWLAERNFTEASRSKREGWLKVKPRTWGSEMLEKLPTFDFHEVSTLVIG